MQDFGYNAHRRVVNGISGTISKGTVGGFRKGDPFVSTARVHILETREAGQVRTVTVLDGEGPQAKAVARLAGNARY